MKRKKIVVFCLQKPLLCRNILMRGSCADSLPCAFFEKEKCYICIVLKKIFS